MQRLVTAADKQKYPQLNSMGVSVNQHFNFDFLEAQEKQNEAGKGLDKDEAKSKVEVKNQKIEKPAPKKEAKKNEKK